jgi:hypothetical protein
MKGPVLNSYWSRVLSDRGPSGFNTVRWVTDSMENDAL